MAQIYQCLICQSDSPYGQKLVTSLLCDDGDGCQHPIPPWIERIAGSFNYSDLPATVLFPTPPFADDTATTLATSLIFRLSGRPRWNRGMDPVRGRPCFGISLGLWFFLIFFWSLFKKVRLNLLMGSHAEEILGCERVGLVMVSLWGFESGGSFTHISWGQNLILRGKEKF